jgi:colanic acid biosynthesis protein WcaH
MIEQQLYNSIIEVLPILCVDGFIVKDNKILLLKRNNYPALGEWWVPGGRVIKNETLNDAMIRKIKDEIQLDSEVVEQIGITETIFETKHTINICFLVKINSHNIILNSEHSEYKWFSENELPTNLNLEIKNIIKNIII